MKTVKIITSRDLSTAKAKRDAQVMGWAIKLARADFEKAVNSFVKFGGPVWERVVEKRRARLLELVA